MNVKRILFVLLFGSWSLPSLAALTLPHSPLFIAAVEPRIMLVVSRDHQLSMKAFTDYTDLTDDALVDSLYNDTIRYDGYFDADRCYSYNNSATPPRFEPAEPVAGGTHQCGGSTWSGNFLNWGSMTRMDLLRKNLYGGYRVKDTVGEPYETVLERQFLPVDVHAFAKVYAPPSTPTLAMPAIQSLTGVSGQTAISLCNVTDTASTTLTGRMALPLPSPLIKVAAGAWPQWDAAEVTECAVNIGNSTQPTALLATYDARVQVCVADKLEANCKPYTHPITGVATLKPIGLLQKYGDVDADRRSRLGLMTGSYAANKSGGVLRKNVMPMTNNNNADPATGEVCGNNNPNDEIDACNGQFINQAATAAGIVNTLNRQHIAGFQYTSGGRNGSYQYSCNSPGILSFSNGQCVDWGSPLGEMYLETLRYFAAAGPTPEFNVSDAAVLSSLPKVSWSDPLPQTQWCALSSVVVLSTGLNSFDTDQLTSFTPSGGTLIDPAALTVTVGDAAHEDINGGSYMIGSLVGASGSNANNQCTAKTVSDLAHAKGICPEVPSLEGGYAIAGLAYAPKTIDLRPDYADRRAARWGGPHPINADWALRQPFDTYTLQLAETLPSFSPAVGGGRVTLLPACQANSNASTGVWTTNATGWRNCSMTNLVVDANVTRDEVGTDTSAKTKTCSGNGITAQCFTITWEDSTWGNDYDMDGIARLGYCVGTACARFKMLCPSTGSAYATIGPWMVLGGQLVIATCATQAQAGHALTFGYIVSGSTNDGPFYPILRQGGQNFNVGARLPSSGVTAASNVTFSQGASVAGLLKNPLWYAAKYGGFTESTPSAGTPAPDVRSEWDGDAVGTPGYGIPDNYYEIRNPALLATALSGIFDAASQPDAAAASVATNSSNLQIAGRIFQGKFSSADWSGQLLSYRIDTNGVLAAIPEWDAAVKLNAQDPMSGRTIITRGSAGGVPFVADSLTAAQLALLDVDVNGVTDGCGLDRVNYVRGSDAREGPNGTFTNGACSASKFRQRRTTQSGQPVHFKLGDIVHSSPWYSGAPQAGYAEQDYPGYGAFRAARSGRTPVVYVGANDGMLHGFDVSLAVDASHPDGVPTATAGKEVLAYIPTAVLPNLSRLTAQTYNKNHWYFVDGSPLLADVDLDDSPASFDWRTVLIGGLAGGGKGYYALDVSDPATFSESGVAPARTALWEFDDVDMGYVFNLPPVSTLTKQAKQIVRLCTDAGSPCTNSRWAAVLGNGYNSVTGKAALYVLFINAGVDGAWSFGDFVKLVAAAPVAPATDGNNGLSTPVPVDTNGDGYTDTVYAGDLQGNLWKFLIGYNASDPSVTGSPTTWKVAFGGAPLFRARDSAAVPQPIISPPEVTALTTGQLILFGTGKFLERSDTTGTAVQTFYGIWDKHDGTTTVSSRGLDLLEQRVTEVALPGGNYRIPSQHPIDWRVAAGDPAANCAAPCTPTYLGWYLDLPTSGERTTAIPRVLGRLLFFNTFIPSTEPCNVGGTGWLMTLDWRSGGLPSFQVFDTNASGEIGSGDTPVGGYQVGAVLGGTNLIAAGRGGSVGVGVSSLTGGRLVSTLINFGGMVAGRSNWREIVQ
ncbi:PilC/PilY family type IV pilus protein [uncultured Thiodictyon sp.]|uniref:pilus assembly protein n=1 Tax=uncultured Thiodictyon sp. TaxID=1846217 RepID=UPI0025FB3C35|nr:PilC/PilY family type IV pilus protein [uncultured Thiodictyon sp.]